MDFEIELRVHVYVVHRARSRANVYEKTNPDDVYVHVHVSSVRHFPGAFGNVLQIRIVPSSLPLE